MTWDLLTGRVTRDHPLWERLTSLGFEERLYRIVDDPCPPDVIGVNHYLTSDRFLDHRLARYPGMRPGGNGIMRYVDVEAVRVLQPGPQGLEGALHEAAARYRLPVAVTECHNGCTREEQVRWLNEAWETANALRAEGVRIEAVTAWSLLGSFNWDTLLTRADGRYECGAFDVRRGAPRPTALARAIKAIARGTSQPNVAAAGAGWWRRDVRLSFAPSPRVATDTDAASRCVARGSPAAPLLIVGATGTLGQALARACEWRGLDYVLTGRRQLSMDRPETIDCALDRYQPWALINAAGWVRVDDAETLAPACHAANATGALALAQACGNRDIRFVTFSSDLVFDGAAGCAYVEDDPVNPLNVYGESKAAAEKAIRALGSRALIVRTAAFFSPHDPHNFASSIVRELAAGRSVCAARDSVVSPTYVPDLVDSVLDLTLDGEEGLWHLANEGAVSWFSFAQTLARSTGLDAGLIEARASKDMGWRAARPAFSALGSARGQMLRSLDDAVAAYAAVLEAQGLFSEFAAASPANGPPALS
jgi:dTDP-4-dehydrorhamnose reductase